VKLKDYPISVTLFPFTVYVNYPCLHTFDRIIAPPWYSKIGYYLGLELIDYSVEKGGITKE
jgi:hypothetical protein